MKKIKMSRNENSKIKYYVYLVYLIVVTFVVTGISLSRYSKIVPLQDEAQVAKVIIRYVPISATLNGTPVADVSAGLSLTDLEPGDVLVYNFEVRNFEGTEQNMVLMKYMVSVVFDPDPAVLPLTYTLTPGSSYPSPEAGWITLSYGSDITHSYTLTITWDAENSDPGYLNQEQNIRIVIDSVQMDS